jgi:Spy/CpxP family protein refolding chaperone
MKLLALAAVLAIGPAVVSYAQDAPAGADRPKRQAKEGDRPGVRRGGEGEGPFAGLNLTDEQKAKVQEVMAAHREAMKNFMQDNAEAFKAIR